MLGGGASSAAFAAGRSRNASTPACDARAAGAPDGSVAPLSTGGGGGGAMSGVATFAVACCSAVPDDVSIGLGTLALFAPGALVAAMVFAAGGFAGGVVTNWEGGPCYDGGDVLACGDPALHAEVLRRMGSG